MSDQFLRTSAAARFLDCSAETIRILEKKGKIPAIKADAGARLFRRQDLLQFAAERAANKRRIRKARRIRKVRR